MGVDLSASHPAMDKDEHEKTYRLFVKGVIWVTVLVALILGGMAAFLV
jgi:hypothetical protein